MSPGEVALNETQQIYKNAAEVKAARVRIEKSPAYLNRSTLIEQRKGKDDVRAYESAIELMPISDKNLGPEALLSNYTVARLRLENPDLENDQVLINTGWLLALDHVWYYYQTDRVRRTLTPEVCEKRQQEVDKIRPVVVRRLDRLIHEKETVGIESPISPPSA